MDENSKYKAELEGSIALEERVGGQSRQAVSDSPSSGFQAVGDGADVAQATRGLSNTPATAPNDISRPQPHPMVDTSIDWLRARFNGEFKPSPSKDWIWRPLFDALHIDPMLFEEGRGFDGYARGYQYGVHIFVSAGGGRNKNKKKDETFILELSGQGCREFEDYALRDHGPVDGTGDEYLKNQEAVKFDAWKRLIRSILLLGGICTRIDIPTDEFGGFIPFDELKQKIETHTYTSSLKAFKKDKSVPDPEEGDATPAHFVESSHNGWTAMIGTNNSYKIVIYDKIAEVKANHPEITPNCTQWIRFEVRFFHQHAADCLERLLKAYEKGPEEVHRFIVGTLGSLITVKEKLTDKKHMNRVQTWAPWEEFVREGKEYKVLPPVKEKRTLKKNAVWMKDDGARALFRMCATYPKLMKEVVAYLILDGMARADNSDLFIINEHLLQEKEETYLELKDAQATVFKLLGVDPSEIDDRVLRLYGDT